MQFDVNVDFIWISSRVKRKPWIYSTTNYCNCMFFRHHTWTLSDTVLAYSRNTNIRTKKCSLYLTTPKRFNPLLSHRDKFVGTETSTASRLFGGDLFLASFCNCKVHSNAKHKSRLGPNKWLLCVTLMEKSKFFVPGLVSRWNKDFCQDLLAISFRKSTTGAV